MKKTMSKDKYWKEEYFQAIKETLSCYKNVLNGMI